MLWIIVVFYTAGICWAEIFDLPTRMVQFSSLLLTSSLFIFCKIKQKPNLIVTRSLLGLLFFLLGLLQYNQFQSNQPADPHHIYNLIKTKQTVSIKGFLQEYPVVVNKSSGPQTRLLVKIKGFYQAGNHVLPLEHYRKASGLVLITLNGLLPENLVPGDTFLAKTTLSRVHTYSTPGSFNYKKHLAYRSIFIKGWIHTPQNLIKLHSLTPSSPLSVLANLIYLPERIRNNLAAFLNKTLSQPARGLYKAILIGDRDDVPLSVLNNFTKAGCLHILAISGMHMGLLALISIATIFWLLKRSTWLLLHAPVLKISVSLAFLPLFIYALIAGLNIPVLRALLMTTIFILAILFDRPGNLLSHILFAFFLFCYGNPGQFSVSPFNFPSAPSSPLPLFIH
jgi:competence protein ComEC